MGLSGGPISSSSWSSASSTSNGTTTTLMAAESSSGDSLEDFTSTGINETKLIEKVEQHLQQQRLAATS